MERFVRRERQHEVNGPIGERIEEVSERGGGFECVCGVDDHPGIPLDDLDTRLASFRDDGIEIEMLGGYVASRDEDVRLHADLKSSIIGSFALVVIFLLVSTRSAFARARFSASCSSNASSLNFSCKLRFNFRRNPSPA